MIAGWFVGIQWNFSGNSVGFQWDSGRSYCPIETWWWDWTISAFFGSPPLPFHPNCISGLIGCYAMDLSGTLATFSLWNENTVFGYLLFEFSIWVSAMVSDVRLARVRWKTSVHASPQKSIHNSTIDTQEGAIIGCPIRNMSSRPSRLYVSTSHWTQ